MKKLVKFYYLPYDLELFGVLRKYFIENTSCTFTKLLYFLKKYLIYKLATILSIVE